MRLLIYLDDLLLLNQSQTALEKDKCLLLVLLHKLGFVVNQQKSMLISTQKIEYLGFVINSGLLASHRRRLTIDGLAAVCNGTTTQRLWSPSENLDHINILILKAASFGNGICQVLIFNTYSSQLNKLGGTQVTSTVQDHQNFLGFVSLSTYHNHVLRPLLDLLLESRRLGMRAAYEALGKMVWLVCGEEG